jgi:hypothetical protein
MGEGSIVGRFGLLFEEVVFVITEARIGQTTDNIQDADVGALAELCHYGPHAPWRIVARGF